MSDFITQSELAKHFGVSQPYVAKLSKNGVLDGCKKNGKIVRECAIHAIERYRAGGRERIKKHVPPAVIDTPVFNTENMSDLDALLAQVEDPNRSVQLMKDFWTAKLNEYKAKEQKGQLVRLDEVVEANQKIIKAFRDKTLSLPTNLAGVVLTASTQEEVRSLIESAVYDLLEELSRELG